MTNVHLSRTVLSALAASFLVGCSDREDAGYIGYVEAELVYVAAPQAGWLEALDVKEGDAVESGVQLFRLDTTQQDAQLSAAVARAEQAGAEVDDISRGARPVEIEALEAQRDEARIRLAEAKAEYDRWMPLVRDGNASQARGDRVTADYRAAQARLEAAEDSIEIAKLGGREGRLNAASAAVKASVASVDEARWRLAERTVSARTTGRVETVLHRQGEYVAAGSPVLALLPDNGLKVRFFVPQAEITDFAVGDELQVIADGAERPVPATISFIASEPEFTPPVIYSAASRDKLVFLVEARLENTKGLHPGLPIEVVKP